jgi:arginase
MMKIAVIPVPYRYDEFEQGPGKGPAALRRAGIVEALRETGHDITESEPAHLDESDREEGRRAVNIGRLGASTAQRVKEARLEGKGCLVLSGDDTASIGVVAGLQAAHGAGARIGIVWADAHGDFNTPETSYSGILAGMSLAILAGLAGPAWRQAANLAATVPTDRILIAGARQLDAKEEALLRVTDVRILTTQQACDADRVQRAVELLAEHSDMLSLHVDLDILDPRFIPSSSTPAPDGLEPGELISLLQTVLRSGKVAALNICGLNPGGGRRGEQSLAAARMVVLESTRAWAESPQIG